MKILEDYLRGDEASGQILADALLRGPVRAVFHSEFSEFGVYFLPEQFVMTRPSKNLCSSA
jgi:hypothetical protein